MILSAAGFAIGLSAYFQGKSGACAADAFGANIREKIKTIARRKA